MLSYIFKFKKPIKTIFVLFIFSIFVGILSASKVDASASATATLTVTNSVPVASNVVISAGATMTLTSGTTTTETVTFTVTDNNGCQDIDSNTTKTTVVLYRTDVSGGVACTPDNANCYAMSCTQDASSCTAGGTDLNATYTCTVAVQFYADPTDTGAAHAATTWTAGAVPADNAGATTANTSTTAEMVSLTSLSVTTTVNYTSLALGADTGTTDQTTVVTNTGNRPIDTQVGGYGTASNDTYSMSCTIGTIPIANEKYSTTASTAYASKISLVTDTSPATITTNIVAGTSSTGDIYWGMGLPATGVGGTCSGHIVFTAVNH